MALLPISPISPPQVPKFTATSPPPYRALLHPRRRLTPTAASTRRRSPTPSPPPPPSSPLSDSLRRHSVLLIHLAAAISATSSLAIPFARASTIPPPPAATVASAAEIITEQAADNEETRAAFEIWKSKTFALTVPLKIVALRGSVPPSWVKDFVQVQGRRMKFNCDYRGSLEGIFSELKTAWVKGRVEASSAMAADIVTVGGSWLSYAIREGLVEPVRHVDEQTSDWFDGLNEKWKAYLRRNDKGELDPNGYVWGAPYRWGTMVIAYKKSNFRKRNMAPIEDWGDLLRPELAGRISIVDSPREVVGLVLKHMGASYNTKDIESQVTGGREAVLHNLRLLQKQVRLFDGTHYLKAFGAGEVWVAVGWSSDVIPAAKRLSDVAVVLPKSGSSLWVDLWAIPSSTKFQTDQIGGRVRSPSPLVHQWIEFCLQTARELPFQQEVIPGASPIALGEQEVIPGASPPIPGASPIALGEQEVIPGASPIALGEQEVIPGASPIALGEQEVIPGASPPIPGASPIALGEQEVIPGAPPIALGDISTPRSEDLDKGKPRLDTNLVNGRPPPEILEKCEFLEPLSEEALEDYSWLISRMQKPGSGWVGSVLDHFSPLLYAFRCKIQGK